MVLQLTLLSCLLVVAAFGVASAGSHALEVESSLSHERALSQEPTVAVRVADFIALQGHSFDEGASESVNLPGAVVEAPVDVPPNTSSPDETLQHAHDVDSEQASLLHMVVTVAMVRYPQVSCASYTRSRLRTPFRTLTDAQDDLKEGTQHSQ